MYAYDDVYFDEQFIDDTQEVTCCMCQTDCPLALISGGCCSYCASLCASAPAKSEADPYTRRAHLVSLTRKAFNAWGQAVELHTSRVSALRPSQDCIEESALLVKHRARRYNLLESRLADETRLDKASVYNQISAFPACARLLRAGL